MTNRNSIFIKTKSGELQEINEVPGLKIDFFQKNNKVIIEEGSVFHNTHFKMRENCQIEIQKTHARGIRNTVVDMAGSQNNKLKIMKNCSIESCRFAMANESNLIIEIGEDCMFSSNIVFRATDGHAIFEKDSKTIINRSKPIHIGNHVWLGSSAIIMKGSIIPNDSVVGSGSVVTKKFLENNVAIAGNPARVVKSGINWDRSHIDAFDKQAQQTTQQAPTQKTTNAS